MEKEAVDFFGRLSGSFGPSGFGKEPVRIVHDPLGAFAVL